MSTEEMRFAALLISPYQARPRSKSRAVSQSLAWLRRNGFIVLDVQTWEHRVTPAGLAAHDADPGLFL